MGQRWLVAVTAMAVALACPGCGEKTVTMEEFNTRTVTLPDGFQVRAEVMMHPEDMLRGMMFRESLPEGRGMLFIHGEPGLYPYWMYQVRIPLDILWLDHNGKIVEISADTPPCKTDANSCPNYGGHELALAVLELPAGSVKKHNLKVGMTVRF